MIGQVTNGQWVPGQLMGGISQHLMPSPKGWKSRFAASTVKNEERVASLEQGKVRQHVTNVMNAQNALSNATDRLKTLRRNLDSKRELYKVHKRSAAQSGKIHPDMQKLKFAIEEIIPEAISNAETEIEAAHVKLAEVERRRDEAFATAAAAEAEAENAGEPEPVEVKRGPGRPRKVSA